jgi:glutamine amidotransferase
MCRLILAVGRFSVADVLAAAVAMSTGRTADHDGPIQVHPNGWGAVWRSADAPHWLAAYRDVRALDERSLSESPLPGVATDFLAVHSRHATLARNTGLDCTHPLQRDGEPPWYFMHNGFLPTVYRNLGLPASEFDSREYFDWIVPPGAERLDEAESLERLAAIEPGGSSGNAIAVNPRAAYLIHWSPPDIRTPRYFAMHAWQTAESTVLASEIVPDLAAREQWRPIPPGRVLELPFPTTFPNPPSRQGEEHYAGH